MVLISSDYQGCSVLLFGYSPHEVLYEAVNRVALQFIKGKKHLLKIVYRVHTPCWTPWYNLFDWTPCKVVTSELLRVFPCDILCQRVLCRWTLTDFASDVWFADNVVILPTTKTSDKKKMKINLKKTEPWKISQRTVQLKGELCSEEPASFLLWECRRLYCIG